MPISFDVASTASPVVSAVVSPPSVVSVPVVSVPVVSPPVVSLPPSLEQETNEAAVRRQARMSERLLLNYIIFLHSL